MSKEYTYSDVSEHSSKKDLFVVIHDNVYDAAKFVDEHPGGEEVLLDVAGQDATEAFEDVGHSDEAREILVGLKVGSLKRMPGDPNPAKKAAPRTVGGSDTATAGMGVGLYAVLLLGGAAAYVTWMYVQNQKQPA